ncbi:Clp amino terminal domain-containing protein, pathogenicity island component [Actinacidiphila yanglinensis]|uniref:Clp amino terminal domain-containing protein, pathogenicity island component n=1 Tax=Actinacidiphila yanglinensis TaxID=310779 RepID=A0A1H5T733_9ACTN|nr:Clp protease N-terminal domain-containing protein [Actinacidiphila yanglinensis]SEF58615.1 Clp amino terminal domain-containing protein, pathogenicity island component [Actinacidiphila yanglinensis]
MSAEAAAAPRLKPVIERARTEAERRGDRRIGTDHLLLALLHDPDAPPARALGVSLDQGRSALDAMDRDALGAIGVHLDMPLAAPPSRGSRRLPLNSAARSAVGESKRFAERDGKGRRIEPRHLLLALLTSRHPDPAADLLGALSLDAPEVRQRLSAA